MRHSRNAQRLITEVLFNPTIWSIPSRQHKITDALIHVSARFRKIPSMQGLELVEAPFG